MKKYFKRKAVYYLKNWRRYLYRLFLIFTASHKPSFMIVGAQKAATTSLFNYLNQLKDLSGSINKEIYFFDRDHNFNRGLRWYHNYFKGFSFRKTQYFEATPNYLYFPWVAERLHNYNAELKLIVVLREPISRAYSAWNMYRYFFYAKETYRLQQGIRVNEKNYIYEHLFKGRKTFPSFRECIEIELALIKSLEDKNEPSILRRGLYYEQLMNLYKYFSPQQVFIIGYKDLTHNTITTVSNLYSFIMDKPLKNQNFKIDRRNARDYKIDIAEDLKNELDAFYRDDSEKLFKLLGKNINW